MPIEINMPRLSDTMEEGTLIKWRVKVGDKVKSGDLLADIETDKATMELQAYDDGTVAELAVQEGQVVPIGTLILRLAEEGESVSEAVSSIEPADAGSRGSSQPSPEVVVEATTPSGQSPAAAATGLVSPGRVVATPVARKMAQEHGLDLGGLRGSGPGGRIIKRDIEAVLDVGAKPHSVTLSAPVVVPSPTVQTRSETIPLSNMRKTIARRLVQSKTTIPHFTVTVTVCMDGLLDIRSALNQQLDSQGVRLSVNDFVVRASALALVRHRSVNSSWTDDGIQQHGGVNVGVAISVPPERGGGLVVATIRHAADKTLRQINAETRLLAEKARGQGLSMDDMAEGTFTISNLGMYGVAHFEAIINPPQAAILAVGAAVEKPVVRDGQVVAGHEMSMTLSADHRVIDGAMAAQFLQTLRQMLESPAVILV